MMVKVILPVSGEKGEALSDHFGRAPFFAWYEVESGKVLESGIVPNTSDHFGGSGHPPSKIISLGAEVVISMGMGMKAINLFQEAKVAVLRAESNGSENAIKAFIANSLPELTEGCLHSHDH